MPPGITHSVRRAEPDCSACHWGVMFDDTEGTRCCYVHASQEQRDLVAALDDRAPGVGLRRAWHRDWRFHAYAWPYGPNVDAGARARMLDWAEANGLQLARPSRGRCLCQVRSGQCSRAHRDDRDALGWKDHCTLWMCEGRPAVLVAQPYVIDPRGAERLQRIASEPGLRLELTERGTSWYGHDTYFIGVWAEAA